MKSNSSYRGNLVILINPKQTEVLTAVYKYFIGLFNWRESLILMKIVSWLRERYK